MKLTLIPSLAIALVLTSCSFFKHDDNEVANTSQQQPVETQTPVEISQPVATPSKPVVSPVQKVTKPTVKTPETPKASVKPISPTKSAPSMPGIRVARVSVPENVVALTFDDGPHGTLTPRVLDILSRYNAKCTFFMQGQNVKRYPNVVRRMVAEGHEPASHTWDHICMTKNSRAKIESELAQTDAAIRDACGYSPRLVRPPYGATNAGLNSMMRERFGYSVVLWDVDTNDWRKPGVSTVISRAVNGAKPGSIILVHDIHSSTVDAVEGIVRGLQNRGFRLVTVSQMIEIGRRYARQAGQAVAPTTPAVTTPATTVTPSVSPVTPVAPVVTPEVPSETPTTVEPVAPETPITPAQETPALPQVDLAA